MEVRLSMLERRCQFPAVLIQLRHALSRHLAREVGEDREHGIPVACGMISRDLQPTTAMLVALCIHHTHALLRELPRWRATARAQRAAHLPGQSLMFTDHEAASPRVDLGEKGAGTKIAIGDPQIIPRDARKDRPEERALLRMAIFTGKDIGDEP